MRFIGHEQSAPVFHHGELPVWIWRVLPAAPHRPRVADQAGAGLQSRLGENLAFVDGRATHDQCDGAVVRRRIAYIVQTGLQRGTAQVLHVATISSPGSAGKPFLPHDNETLGRASAVDAHVPATVNGERLLPPATPPMEESQSSDPSHEVELARIDKA